MKKKPDKKENIEKTIVGLTQRRFCPECGDLRHPYISTEIMVFGLLNRTFPACSECIIDLAAADFDIGISYLESSGLLLESFTFKDIDNSYPLIMNFREIEEHLRNSQDLKGKFKKELFNWRKWCLSEILNDIGSTSHQSEGALKQLLSKFEMDKDSHLGKLVIDLIKDIDLKSELLELFSYNELIKEEKRVINDRYNMKLAELKEGEHNPMVIPTIQMYRYELIYIKIHLDYNEEEEEKKGSFSEKKIEEIEPDYGNLFFNARSQSNEEIDGKDATIVRWQAIIVIDNDDQLFYLYRPEGFGTDRDSNKSFESRSILDNLLGREIDDEREESYETLSREFLETLPPNDQTYISWKMGKPYLNQYEMVDILFKGNDNEEGMGIGNRGKKGKKNIKLALFRLVMGYDEEEKIQRYQRLGICRKCTGFSRPFLNERWICPNCGAQDPSDQFFCSCCNSDLKADEQICSNCREFLI